ncbi:uncharacterized protein LOC123529965 isoform X1 [Mercenaria mercenaria]|uniref:uncharacterized protein LOC123529965 isoform X1 n=1 Tax=Mercenaria mercenaria TaxID=6596 RepID=UPI00234EB582|nr:uncharacterized protein LOC123529965 isoform X1 [Mercenaria mercenaria]
MGLGIYAITVGLIFVLPCVLGCSKFKPGARASETKDDFDTDERKVYYSEVVVFGEIVGKVAKTDKRNFPYKDVEGVDTVEFKVNCTYLGGPDIPSTIYISGIGNENGEIPGCPPAPVGASKEAVMFLKRAEIPGHNDVFETEFKPNFGEVEIMLDDLSLTCGLNLTENSHEICKDYPPLTLEEECIKWEPIVITPKPKPEKTTKPKPVVTPKPEPVVTPKPEPVVTPKPDSEGEPTEPEPKEEETNIDTPDDTVIDIDATNNGKNDKSDPGYKTDKNTAPAGTSTGDNGNGSTLVTSSLLVTLITFFLTIVV